MRERLQRARETRREVAPQKIFQSAEISEELRRR
jgi:hypothetical protein